MVDERELQVALRSLEPGDNMCLLVDHYRDIPVVTECAEQILGAPMLKYSFQHETELRFEDGTHIHVETFDNLPINGASLDCLTYYIGTAARMVV